MNRSSISAVSWIKRLKLPAKAHIDGAPPTMEADDGPRRKGGKTCLIIGALLAILLVGALAVTAILVAIGAPALDKAQHAAEMAECQNNLKQLGVVLKLWSNEHHDLYPPLSADAGHFLFRSQDLYPEYIGDPAVLICPSDPSVPHAHVPSDMDDHSYFYLGYAVTSESEARAFLAAYEKHVRANDVFEGDLSVRHGEGIKGGDALLRLRDGVERFYVADLANPLAVQEQAASIPVMFDRAPHHQPESINVLYLDGHVENVPMGAKFPALPWFLDALNKLEQQYE